MPSETCPLCSGPLTAARPIDVCGGCARGVEETGALQMTSTAEFAAFGPSALDPMLDGAATTPPRRTGAASCTWCGRPQAEVKKLLSGGGAHICNECVALCADVLLAELGDGWR